MKRKRGYKRGYPVALLLGFEEKSALLWQVFSHVARLHFVLKLNGKRTDEKALYNFHESIFDALRPILEEGVRSIVVMAPMKTTYATDFLNHVHKHHTYLTQPKNPNRVTLAELIGSADRSFKVAELVKTKEFHRIIAETTTEEADNIVKALEKHLSDGNAIVLFSLEEIEGMIYDQQRHGGLRTKYLMLTDKYLSDHREKNRINRLMQVSRNNQVKTRIVKSETPAGKRISQFGGIVFFTLPTK